MRKEEEEEEEEEEKDAREGREEGEAFPHFSLTFFLPSLTCSFGTLFRLFRQVRGG